MTDKILYKKQRTKFNRYLLSKIIVSITYSIESVQHYDQKHEPFFCNQKQLKTRSKF